MVDEAPSTTAEALEGMERDAALEAWTAVLDDLEAALDSATVGTMDGMTDALALGAAIDEATAADRAHDPAPGRMAPALARYAVAGSWAPPRLESPIPDALLARARRIRERQVAVLSRLAADADTLRRHRAALGSVRAATAPRQSAVYLDVTG
ncbi:hypothetical protein ACX80N_06870 [Arthrobacter sp. MDT2-16]